MNMKEAFRYLNHLDVLTGEARDYVQDGSNCSLITQVHRKSRANAEAQDEVLTTEQIRENWNRHKDVMQVVDFLLDLIREKEELNLAIADVKAAHPFRMDAQLAVNKTRQEMARALDHVAHSSHPNRCIRTGRAYKFNAEGNQVAYCYDIEEQTEPAFDRGELKKKLNALRDRADEVSAQADAFLVNTEVLFAARYRVSDGFDDAFERFVG